MKQKIKKFIKKRFLRSEKEKRLSFMQQNKPFEKMNFLTAGDCIVVAIWLYKSASRYRRIAKKSLKYHSRVIPQADKLRYKTFFFGRCIKIVKRTGLVELRAYCGKVGMNLTFFLKAPNFIDIYIMDFHRRFRFYNKNSHSKLYRYKFEYIRKKKRQKEY
jgi:hypothetical protein